MALPALSFTVTSAVTSRVLVENVATFASACGRAAERAELGLGGRRLSRRGLCLWCLAAQGQSQKRHHARDLGGGFHGIIYSKTKPQQ